jgi:alkylation response protein AidB-like acyl-CoA dehydrogenase
METVVENAKKALKGGEFLVAETKPEDVFIIGEFSEEQLMVIKMVQDFIRQRVVPNSAQIEKLDIELTTKLLREAGEQGILGTSFPEEYGGYKQDFLTNMAITEVMSEGRSFSLSYGANVGIGMLPILYFGTEAQKTKYLPDLVAGHKFAAYCLTEPDSGSDALAAKSRAVLSEDGQHYILNGQKMWITNAGFADVFVVFAKIDGDKFTGFIVERNWEGLTLGAEEAKLGIKGSSTRQVFFENVKVPVENVLGEIGKGHRIAFNILNIGRIKLAAGVLGGAKMVCTQAIRYANERKQFGKFISSFGAIQHKIAEMAVRVYATESAMYRTSKDIDSMEKSLEAQGKPLSEALLAAAEEYAIECAILKVRGSECLNYAVDEGLQIYGGMGYSEEAPMAGAYRDARINRIFEGTNEINRMLSVDMLLKRALKGHIDILTPALAVQKELTSFTLPAPASDELLATEMGLIRNMKKAFLAVAGATVQALTTQLETEQEILMNLSDIMSEIYLSESAVLRTLKRVQYLGADKCEASIQMAQVYVNDAVERVAQHARATVAAWADGDMKRTLLLAIKRFTKFEPINTKELRRRIAERMIAAGEYTHTNAAN